MQLWWYSNGAEFINGIINCAVCRNCGFKVLNSNIVVLMVLSVEMLVLVMLECSNGGLFLLPAACRALKFRMHR